jgi:hypothetical protein
MAIACNRDVAVASGDAIAARAAAEHLAKAVDRHVLAAELEQADAPALAAVGPQVFCALDVPHIAAAEGESFLADIAAQDPVVVLW